MKVKVCKEIGWIELEYIFKMRGAGFLVGVM